MGTNIILPKDVTPPSRKTPRFLYIYGQEKIGKTTILAALTRQYNALIIGTDMEGAEHTNSRRIQATDYKSLMEILDTIIKEGKPYSHVCLDTTTTLEDWCDPAAVEYYKTTNMGKNFTGSSILELVGPDFNPGYEFIRIMFKDAMSKLMRCAPYIIGVGHIRDKFLRADQTEKGKSDHKVSTKEIAHAGKIRSMICVGADAIGYLYRNANQDGSSQTCYLSFQTSEHQNCGNRSEYLSGQVIRMSTKETEKEIVCEGWQRIYEPKN